MFTLYPVGDGVYYVSKHLIYFQLFQQYRSVQSSPWWRWSLLLLLSIFRYHSTRGLFTVPPCGDGVYYFSILSISRYNSTTGVFTVPHGGDGVYYFSTYLLVQFGELGWFHMEHNGRIICNIDADYHGSTNYGSTSCSAVARFNAGDKVHVHFDSGDDNTPLITDWFDLFNGFSGFKIWAESVSIKHNK